MSNSEELIKIIDTKIDSSTTLIWIVLRFSKVYDDEKCTKRRSIW